MEIRFAKHLVVSQFGVLCGKKAPTDGYPWAWGSEIDLPPNLYMA
jgi:hypothetical protein